MHFEYTDYVMGCMVLPICVILFAVTFFIFVLLHGLTAIKHNGFSYRKLVHIVLALLVCCFFFILNIGRLFHGGFYLVAEREHDAVKMQGTISDINDLNRFSFPELKNVYKDGQTNGAQLIINGITCIAISSGDLEVGDFVTVTYLPRSKYILSIEKEIGVTQKAQSYDMPNGT